MTPEHPSDPAPRSLQLDGVSASYTDEGEGFPIVAVHGLPGSRRDYRYLAPCLLPGHRFIRLEMPGFGGTPLKVEPHPGVSARAGFVLRMLSALELERCILIGHSFAGPVVVEAAVLAPERIVGLTLLACAGLRPHRMRRAAPLKLVSFLLRLPGVPTLLQRPLRTGFRKMGFSSSLTVQEMLHTLHCAAATSFSMNAAWVRQLRTPTFVAWCEDDPLVEPTIGEELGVACPPGPRMAFPKGGHNLQKTQAVELGSELSQWIENELLSCS